MGYLTEQVCGRVCKCGWFEGLSIWERLLAFGIFLLLVFVFMVASNEYLREGRWQKKRK